MMYEENPESGSRNCEEIYGNHARHVIFQERPLRLGWRLRNPTMYQVGDCSLGDLDSQLERLAMNSERTPERIRSCDLKDKATDLRADRRPSGTFESGLELPEQLETLSMPPDDSFGFDDDQWLLPVAPKTTKHDPKKTVFCSNLRPLLMTFQDGQLLAERKVFQSQIGILLRSK